MQLDEETLASMVAEVEEAGGVLQPSRFWAGFGARNTAALLGGGIDTFKRSVNYNYFQWVINSPRQPEFASVLRTWLAHPSVVPFGSRVCAGTVDWSRPRSPRQLPERFRSLGHALYVAMLWDVGRRSVSPAVIERLEESELGRPIVVCHRRRRISEDLANSLLEYASIAVHVPEHRLENARVIDIGAGYGRFADLFLMAHEEARVLVVDIPPALALSQAYLTARHPDLPAHRFARGIDAAALHEAISRSQLGFVTPNQFASLAPLGFDLVVNVSSLHEMTHEQVAEYLRLIDYHAAGGFFYTKQWGHWRNEIDDVDTDRDSYPYPATWRRLLDRTPVAQPAFFEALFAVNPE